jgi:hypothetical protein
MAYSYVDLVAETLHYNVAVHRAYTSCFKGLADQFWSERGLLSTLEQ